jgi:hypothetical protein
VFGGAVREGGREGGREEREGGGVDLVCVWLKSLEGS